MEAPPLDWPARLGDLFAQLVRVSLSDRVVAALAEHQVTYPQYEAMRYIQRHPAPTVGDLSQGMRISYPSATNMVARLHRKGLLRKRGLRSDRRIVRITLTPVGSKLVERVAKERALRVTTVLDAMGPYKRARFIDALEGFIRVASCAGIAEPGDICLRCGREGNEMCPLVQAGTGHTCM
ncbi:MAG: MarR family transcriptional regulator [Armatimonadetes bacterium]|nr:MarR family transcriptional regulator [Armatimonadota bacterium]